MKSGSPAIPSKARPSRKQIDLSSGVKVSWIFISDAVHMSFSHVIVRDRNSGSLYFLSMRSDCHDRTSSLNPIQFEILSGNRFSTDTVLESDLSRRKWRKTRFGNVL